MSLALVVLGISMVLGCPPSSNSTGDGGGRASDTTAPTLESSDPRDGADDFPAGSNIILTYSEPVLAGTGEITLSYSDGTTMPVTGLQVSIAGAVVTIDPTNPLEEPKVHALVIPAGAFMDAAGNTTAEDTISFTTADLDETAPVLLSSVPLEGNPNFSAGFPIGQSITLTYDEPVQAGTGDITLAASDETTIMIPVGDEGQVSFAGSVVTINPTADLIVSTTYTLTVEAGAIEDASGNEGIVETRSFSTAAAADNTAPIFVSSVPVAGGTTSRTPTIELTYNEDLQRGAGAVTITPTDGSSAGILIPDGDTQVNVSGRRVTITPTPNPEPPLTANLEYTLTIPSGVIQDLVGNAAAVYTLTFTASEGTVPEVISTSIPTDGTIETTANIVLTFSEAVVKGSGSITLTGSGSTIVPIPVSDEEQVTIGGTGDFLNRVVTINPTADLAMGIVDYHLGFPVGTFESMDDNVDAKAYGLSFMTVADTTDPFVDLSVPASGGTIQATEDIVLTFNETVTVGSGVTTFSFSQGGITTITINVTDSGGQVTIDDNVVTINPSADLTAGSTAALIIPVGVFVDLAGNDSVEYTLDFVVAPAADTDGPTLMSTDPVDEAINVPLDTNIVLTYSETVQAGSGNITITPTGGGTALTIAVTDTTQVGILGAVVTIDPTEDLMDATLHTVSIPRGAITDNATRLNPAAASMLTFTTTAPTRRVVLWVGVNQISRLNGGFFTDASGCPDRLKPSVAPDGEDTVTKRFLATGNGNNQNPVNFTVDNTSTGTRLSGYMGATPVYAAHSGTAIGTLTDNDLVANSYADLIHPTTNLLRTLNQAGLNGETERNSIEPTPFWTGITNAIGSSSYIVDQACIFENRFWSPEAVRDEQLANVGVSNRLAKVPNNNNLVRGSAPDDVFGLLLGCEESFNVLCMTY